jgi:RecQ family ATP-dependent DNA helicase
VSIDLARRMLFPAGRVFIPFPVRRGLLRLLEHPSWQDPGLSSEVYRIPGQRTEAPRAWQATSGQSWLRLERALSSSAVATSAKDWIALNGPLDSPAEEAFVERVLQPVLGSEGLRALRAQEAFPLPGGGTGRIDFVLELGGMRVAIEVDGVTYHEGPGEDGLRPERERARQNALLGGGYLLLRYTGREILDAPEAVQAKLREDLDRLHLISKGSQEPGLAPLALEPLSHALLSDWPEDFTRAQQAIFAWVERSGGLRGRESLGVAIPRALGGATVMGLLDVVEALYTAARLRGEPLGLRRVEIWVGDLDDRVRSLLEDRLHGGLALPFEVELAREGPALGTSLALVTPGREGVADEDLVALLDMLDEGCEVLWCTELDARPATARLQPTRPFSDPDLPDVERVMERFFGFGRFRPGQWKIVQRLLTGHSVLGVLPTGAGKTLCFQIPALLQDGVTIVVSPLVSLMDDQVINLRSIGLDFAGRSHSQLSEDENVEEQRRFSAGQYKLFYVSPEKFHAQGFTARLRELIKEQGAPTPYFVVDEAHLASEWGHDFRPSYLTLPHAHAAICPDAPVALLTATAPRHIRDDLLDIFSHARSEADPLDIEVVLPPTFDRPELSFEVHRVEGDAERLERLGELLTREIPASLGFEGFADLHGTARPGDQVDHGGLVFTPWGKPGDKRVAIRASNLAEILQEQGLPAEEYRSTGESKSGQPMAVKNRHTQERFKRNELPLIVATKGFGTGIDKPDIRYVIHADPPGSLEALYQEAGRAGRDGADARSALLWRPRHPDCSPEGAAPSCTATRHCPHGLAETCSFGVQAGLRSSNQPGASEELETSITIWRQYFAGATGRTIVLPRWLEVEPITREEVADRTESILWNLHELGLCGAPSVPRDPTRPIFVTNALFSRDAVLRALRDRGWGGSAPAGASDESFIASAVRLGFGLSEQEAQDHAAVWAMYLRHRQLEKNKKTAVLRRGSGTFNKKKPEVERLLARLMSLGVVEGYHYKGTSQWAVQLSPKNKRKPRRLRTRLNAILQRHLGLSPSSKSLGKDWNSAVEAALRELIAAWYETIAVRSWDTLENLEEFAAATDCRRQRITQYMNESAVAIPVPCGHCDNCGIQPLEAQRPVKVDSWMQDRVAAFNAAFESMVAAPAELEGARALMDIARAGDLVRAVRDRAARHLERASYDPAPRLAATLAAHELDEPGVAARHARMLIETVGRSGQADLLEHVVTQHLPVEVLGSFAEDLLDLLAPLTPESRERVLYRVQRQIGSPAAWDTLTAIIRRASARLTPPFSVEDPHR